MKPLCTVIREELLTVVIGTNKERHYTPVPTDHISDLWPKICAAMARAALDVLTETYPVREGYQVEILQGEWLICRRHRPGCDPEASRAA